MKEARSLIVSTNFQSRVRNILQCALIEALWNIYDLHRVLYEGICIIENREREILMSDAHAHLHTLQILTPEEAPEGSRSILDSTKVQMGMVPNMYAEMAHSPGLFSTYRSGYDAFRSGSGFDKTEQEIVFLAISRFNECTYCVAVHSIVADRNKVPTEVTDAIRTGRAIPDAKLQTLNAFTIAMVSTRGRPSVQDLQEFVSAGYEEKFVLEIILAIAVKTISNYTNHLFDTPLDSNFSHRQWTS